MGSSAKDQIAIILHSGSYDRVSYALSLATAALAMGSKVHMLLTYGGLKRFSLYHLEDLGEETSADIRVAVKRGLGSGGIRPMEQSLADAKRLGLRLYACSSAMANLNISRDQLLPEVDQVIGLVTFIALAQEASVNLYI